MERFLFLGIFLYLFGQNFVLIFETFFVRKNLSRKTFGQNFFFMDFSLLEINFILKNIWSEKNLVRKIFGQKKTRFDGFFWSDFFGWIYSSWVKMRLHIKSQLPGVPGSALKVCGGWWWWLNVNLVFRFGPNLRLEE